MVWEQSALSPASWQAAGGGVYVAACGGLTWPRGSGTVISCPALVVAGHRQSKGNRNMNTCCIHCTPQGCKGCLLPAPTRAGQVIAVLLRRGGRVLGTASCLCRLVAPCRQPCRVSLWL